MSIECDFKATYTPCSASTSDADCKHNAHFWTHKTGGSNVDISSVDASKIAINSEIFAGWSNGGGDFSVYENDDCSGASYSMHIADDAMTYEQKFPHGSDISLVSHDIAVPGFSFKAGDIKSVRIPNRFAA